MFDSTKRPFETGKTLEIVNWNSSLGKILEKGLFQVTLKTGQIVSGLWYCVCIIARDMTDELIEVL